MPNAGLSKPANLLCLLRVCLLRVCPLRGCLLRGCPLRGCLLRACLPRAAAGWVLAAGLLSVLLAGPSRAQRSQILDVVTLSDSDEPFAPSPVDKQGKPIPGQGLCAAFRPTTLPLLVFPSRDPLDPKSSFKQFVDRANQFMDVGGEGAGAVRYATLQSYFDLSSGVNLTNNQSIGDYRNTPGCPKDFNTGTEIVSSGCRFPGAYGDLQSGFGTRFRGFLNVPPGWMKFTVHFGFYTDDAVAVTVWRASSRRTRASCPTRRPRAASSARAAR